MGPTERDEFRRRVDDAVLVLFALVSEGVGWATAALLDQDLDLAQEVIAGDRGIDERCEELIGLVKERLSGGTMLDPDELENLIAVLQIVPELERSADLVEHIAQRTLDHLGGMITPRSRGLIQAMSNIAVEMWRDAGTAYRHGSRDASFKLSEADDELDDLATGLVSEGVLEGTDPQVAVNLALIARFYERLGDHAVNLARRVDVMVAPRRLAGPAVLARRVLASPVPGEKRGGVRRVLHGLSRLRIVPTDEGFFDLFRAAANNARDCAGEVSKLVVSANARDEHFEEIKGFERRGDEITIDLLRRLDASFVTPFDREDIHELAEELDDVVDDMFAAASLLQLTDHDQHLPELGELADILVTMTDEMVALTDCLQTKKGARFRLERVERLERQGDAIFQRGLARLFSGEYETLEVVKLKDIIQALENSCNAIEDVSDVVESILVKNS